METGFPPSKVPNASANPSRLHFCAKAIRKQCSGHIFLRDDKIDTFFDFRCQISASLSDTQLKAHPGKKKALSSLSRSRPS